MWFHRRPSWFLSDNKATDESVWQQRRTLMKAAAAAPIAAGAGLFAFSKNGQADHPEGGDPSAHLYPAARNPNFASVDRPITSEELATHYTNFYEFGSSKDIWEKAQALETRPWVIKFDGMVENEFELDIDDLLKKVALEERVYRFRCVEAWAMTVPWTGFPMRKLVELAKPLSKAKYVMMQTFEDKAVASGQRAFWYPWPYTEGLTIEEATNELAMMVTGIYGKPLPKQNGSPIRLITPWKYGFKSIKSIVRFTFTDKRPVSFWEELNADEYGFWANVNPQVSHPRWSQATERRLGDSGRVPTLLYNGYAEQVASMYDNPALQGQNLFR